MLTFDFEDYRQAHKACLERFRHNLLITASINSLRELFLAGRDQYLKTENQCQLLEHNALGFRIIAANVFAVMLKTALQEHYGEKLTRECVCYITGTEPDYEKTKEFMHEVRNSMAIKMLDRPDLDISEPALDKWWKVFNLPYSMSVDLNTLYYTNDNSEKNREAS